MTLDPLLRETFKEWAEEARVPQDLADRALSGRTPRAARRRWVTVALAAAATAAVVAGGVLVPRLIGAAPGPAKQPAATYPAPTPVDTSVPMSPPAEVTAAELPASLDIRTDTGNSPPKNLIAAGRVAVSDLLPHREGKDRQGQRPRSRHLVCVQPRHRHL